MSRKLSKKQNIELDEYKQKLLRLQADFDNYRKRTQDEKEEILSTARADTILDIVPVLDNFQRSLEHIPNKEKNSEWVKGITYIYKQLEDILSKSGLEKINTKDTVFNPNLHEAISYESSKNHSKDQIIDEIESGWKFGEKVLKVAKVRVAK